MNPIEREPLIPPPAKPSESVPTRRKRHGDEIPDPKPKPREDRFDPTTPEEDPLPLPYEPTRRD